MTLGEYLVKLLENYDVDTVFGIPGVHTVEMYRGLASSPIRHVTPRHEQGAGFMADGYARVSGKPGVCLLITGPGLTNAVTAMAQAYADSVPMLVISAINSLGSLGHGEGELHESPDQGALAAQAAAFSFRVLKPEDLPRSVARAFALFDGARPRPVHIEIPVDLFAAGADHLPLGRPVRVSRARPAEEATAAAAQLCADARRPVILLGGGARRAGEAAAALAERLDAPVVMTTNARGALAPDHPLAVSASPSLEAVRAMAQDADLALAFGTEFGWTDYNMFNGAPFAVSAPMIRCDIEAEQLARNHVCDVALLGDAGAAIRDLLAALGEGRAQCDGAARAESARSAAWREQSDDYKAMIDVMHALRDAAPDAVVVGDSTQLTYAGNLCYAAARPRAWFNAATGYGALGYGLPAAIGARAAASTGPVICLTGDGGLQFVLGELGAAKEVGGPLLILVWNNQGYGEIKTSMQASGVAPVGVDLHTPDFAAIAKAYGIGAEVVDDPAEIASRAAALLARGVPALLEYRAPSI